MRTLMKVTLPIATFNAAVKDGSAGPKIEAILRSIQPEAIYFTEMNGQRTVILIVDVEKPSMIPSFAEPWFLTFNSEVEVHPVISPQELQDAGLDRLGKKWGAE